MTNSTPATVTNANAARKTQNISDLRAAALLVNMAEVAIADKALANKTISSNEYIALLHEAAKDGKGNPVLAEQARVKMRAIAATTKTEETRTARNRRIFLKTKPEATDLVAAQNALLTEIKSAAKLSVERDANTVTTIARAVADLAWHLVSGYKVPGQDKIERLPVNGKMPTALIAYIKSLKGLERVDVQEELGGSAEKSNVVTVARANAFLDQTQDVIRRGVVRGILLQMAEQTKCFIGYYAGEKLPSTTKLDKCTWFREPPAQPYFSATCIPHNVRYPWDFSQRTRGEKTIMVDMVANPCEDGRYLQDYEAEALLAHYLDGEDLYYETEAPQGRPVSGRLIRKPAARAASSGTGAVTVETILAAHKSEIDKTLIALGITMRDKRMAEWQVPTPLETLAILSSALCEAVKGLQLRGEIQTKWFAESKAAASMFELQQHFGSIFTKDDDKPKVMNNDREPTYVVSNEAWKIPTAA